MLDAKSPFADPARSNSCLPFFNFGDQSKRGAVAAASNRSIPNDTSELGMKSLEDFLASEMNNLSVQERSKALDDLHCVGEELHETPEIIENLLQDFEHELQQEHNSVYEMAVNQNRSYVEDPAFRLKFLRAALHDVGKAVRNMLEFLRYKATYFGNEKVARDITLDDLNEEDKELLLSGLHHIQDGTDRMGRVIVYFFNKYMGIGTLESHVRVTYYVMFNILASMPAVQKKGIVNCYYDLSRPGEHIPKPGLNRLMTMIQFINTIPVRSSVQHTCLRTGNNANAALNKFIIEIGIKLFPHSLRVRSRIHYGTDMELQYELQDHGIPIDAFPIDASGKMRQEIQNAWFFKYQATQGLDTNSPPVLDEVKSIGLTDNAQDTMIGSSSPTNPPRHDILLGRGRPIQSHPGNVCFREYLKQFSDEYNEAPRNLRRRVLSKIREDLNSRGIRFLQERSGSWVECSGADAEKTISQAFRNLRKKSKKEESAT